MRHLLYLLFFVNYCNAAAQVMCPAKYGQKWGMISTKGSWIIKPKFDSIAYLYNGYATIYSKNKKNGLIDSWGKIIIKPIYDNVGLAEDGMCLLLTKKKSDTTDYYTSYFNLKKLITIPGNYEDGEDFSDDLACVKNEADKWGFIDKEGRLIIPYRYDAVNSGFHSDTANVELNDSDVYIDKSGDIIGEYIPKRHAKTYELLGVAGHLGRAKLNGDTIMRPIYDYFGYPQDSILWYKLQGKFGLATTDGRLITNAKFDYLTYFSNNLAPARIGNNWGFIRPDGTTAIPFELQYARNFHRGLAAVKFLGLWGFIDINNKWVIKPKYANVSDAFRDIKSKGEAVVKFDYQ